MLETGLLLAAIGLAWFWLDSVQAREIAVAAGSQAAQRCGLQFLDETVALARLRAARDGEGRLRLLRTYGFEVSDTGADRLPCSITLLGKHVEAIDIPPYRDNVIPLFR